ncbi:MAG TPA: nitroreductase family protein [Lachnospiraceae bacterium]|nr:nitroreductase family protein [Lachnospiraceae bacterium]
MEFQACVKTRRSIRKFSEKKVDRQLVEDAVKVASNAPSWKNTQITRYYAVMNQEVKKRLTELVPDFNKPAMESAPVVIVSTVIKNRAGYNRQGECETKKGSGWQMYDCGASNILFCLGANELGLGTVIMGYFDEDAIAQVLEIPETEEVSSVIALGYPAEEPAMPNRKDTDVLLKVIE